MEVDEIVFFKYVRRADVPRFLAAGWTVCQISSISHHEIYAVLLEWAKPGEPPAMDNVK
jgi:hypothetical protein